MKTSELIEQARMLLGYSSFDCANYDSIIAELVDRLEMAYDDLRITEDCEFCMYAPKCQNDIYTGGCKGWQWRGDAE